MVRMGYVIPNWDADRWGVEHRERSCPLKGGAECDAPRCMLTVEDVDAYAYYCALALLGEHSGSIERDLRSIASAAAEPPEKVVTYATLTSERRG